MKFFKNVKQLIVYLIVGLVATVVEWVTFLLFDSVISINYNVATILAFTISTFVNWMVGRFLLFKNQESVSSEIIKIYITGIVGLIMNLIIMHISIEYIGISNFISKVIATGIVFFWNFLARKFLIYKI